MTTLQGERERFAPGLDDLGDGVHAWLQPNGSWGESNAGLVVGDGESLLVDTLWDPILTRDMLHAMEGETARAPIGCLVNTHGDPDHWWGNQELIGAEILATDAARAQMESGAPAELDRLRMLGRGLALAGGSPLPWFGRGASRALGRYVTRMLAPFDFSEVEPRLPTRTFSGRLEIAFGGRRAELIEVGPAHTPGDAFVFVPDARVVFAGDLLFVGATPVMWAGPVANWTAALDLLLELEADIYVPGHGPVTEAEGVRTVRRYWEWLEPAARERFGRGLTVDQAARDLLWRNEFQDREFAEWDNPERIVINLRTLYLAFEGKPTEPGTRELLAVFQKLSRIAAELPDAAPRALHTDL